MCSSLTLQQIYKLTEHHHDDWITGSQTTDTLVLLQTLKRVVDSTVRPVPTMQTGFLELLRGLPHSICLEARLYPKGQDLLCFSAQSW